MIRFSHCLSYLLYVSYTQKHFQRSQNETDNDDLALCDNVGPKRPLCVTISDESEAAPVRGYQATDSPGILGH